MKDGYRFVDCDMHIMEPPDLFDKYLDPEFKHRVTSSVRRVDGGATGMRGRPLWYFDGTPTSNDGNISQYNRIRGPACLETRQHERDVRRRARLRRRVAGHGHGDGRASISRCCSRPPGCRSWRATTWTRNSRPRSAAPITTGCTISSSTARTSSRWRRCCRCTTSTWPAPNCCAASTNTARSALSSGRITSTAATGIRTIGTRSIRMLQEHNIPMCFHEGTGSYYSTIEPRFGENRFMRHVASHSTEMQLALIALMLGGMFEFYPRLKVAFLEAQSWWVPGLLGRIEWDMRQHKDSDAPYLKLTPVRILAAQLLLGDRERRDGGRLGRRTAGRRRQYLRVERFPAFRLELSRKSRPGS